MTIGERDNALKVLKNYDLNFHKINGMLFSAEEIANAFDTAIKALEQQTCEDCISRQKALDCFEQTNTRQGAKYAIETLPSVTPQRPEGRWIATENEEMNIDGYFCSCCDLPMETEERTKFCPNCGAKMKAESEEK